MTTALVLQRLSPWPTISLGAAILVLGGLWLGPLPALSQFGFSPHMLLHLGVTMIAAPLLAVAVAAFLPAPERFGGALQWYLLAAAVEMLAVWGWHVPLLHDATARSGLFFAAEQLSFLGGAVALWTVAFTARTRPAAGAAALTLFGAFVHMSMFGLLLTLAPQLLYDPNLCRGSFGLDALNDQHLGGALMMVGAGLPCLFAAALLCRRALGQ